MNKMDKITEESRIWFDKIVCLKLIIIKHWCWWLLVPKPDLHKREKNICICNNFSRVTFQFSYVQKTYVFILFSSVFFDADSESEIRFFAVAPSFWVIGGKVNIRENLEIPLITLFQFFFFFLFSSVSFRSWFRIWSQFLAIEPII